MTTCTKAQLRDLLTDLYTIFQPENLDYVDGLVDRYISTQYDAIDMLLFKFNHPNQRIFDPSMNTMEYKAKLLKDYSSGTRPLHGIDMSSKMTANFKAKEERVGQQIDQKVSELEKQLKSREDELARFKDEIKGSLQKAPEQEIDYVLNVIDVLDEIEFANKRAIAGLGINSRLICKTAKEKKPIALVVKDIIYDSYSYEEKTVVTVFLEKG